mmetsp:Transcript_29303/g.58493  ORF Transcript_29303/g.58493 Transcript_29303/m.58493 type:complete len:189 (-) Transcript_29303:21-587(-)
MNVLPISLESRPFQALLNGLVKKNFVTGSDISSEYLLGELYAGLDEAEEGQFANEISLYEKILLKAAEQNWEVQRLVEFLSERSLPSDHIQIFSNIWTKESSRINKHMMTSVTWNKTMDRLSWRVDVKALSKTSAEQSDEPVAFFELATKKGDGAGGTQTAKFEMDRSEVQTLLNSLNEIQAVFDGVE